MKYLDGYPELDLLSKSLSFSSPNLRVTTRIEAYSCKAIARERKLFKTIEHDLLSDLSLSTSISPPEQHSNILKSVFGPLDLKSSRKTLWLLIATLNIAFPDHDFSNLNPENFVREENPKIVLSSLTSALSHLRSSNGQEVTPAMPFALEGYPLQQQQQRIGYSSSAPSASASTSLHQQHAKKSIEQKTATSQQSSKQQNSKSQAVEKGNGKKKGSTEGTTATLKGNSTTASAGSDGNEGDKNVQSSTSPPNSKKAQLASQHQPRTKSNATSTSATTTSAATTNKKKKKDNPPISHDILVSKLRNELDGTYEVPTHPLLRQVLDPIIDLSECQVFSYTPDLDSDPHAYQSEDEEEESDEDDLDLDDMDEAEYERQSDGLDMDLEEDDDDTNPYYRSGTSIAKMQSKLQAQQDEMQWEMEGVESNSGVNSTPGTPSASQQGNTAATGSAKKSAQKKRGNSGNTTNVAGNNGSAKKTKGKSASTSRTKIIPGQSIFAEMNQGGNLRGNNIPYQYGSLDEYSYTHHQPRRHSSSLHDDLSSDDDDDIDGRNSNNANDNDDDEADNGGLLWSSNYFFYNKKMKRILFVSCWGRKIGKQFSPSNALLARSAGNPLHAYRRQLLTSSSSMYNHQHHYGLHGMGGSQARTSKDGRVTINLNRPRAGSSNLALPPSTMSNATSTQDENGFTPNMANIASNASGSSKNQNPTSSLTQALRANATSTDSITPSPLNTSFSAQPPIAHAASIFKPSSPFPRSDNRPGSVTPSNLNMNTTAASSTYGTSPTDDPQPPMIRDTSSRQSTPSASGTQQQRTASSGSGRGGERRRVRPNSGTSTPSRKTPKRNLKRRTGSRTPGGASPGTSGAQGST